MRVGLLEHRKFIRLIHTLRIPTAYAVGHLELLWHRSGYMSCSELVGDSRDVEAAADWQGEAGVLTAALLDAGFIDQIDGHFYIHDLFDHAPHHVKVKAQRRTARAQCAHTVDAPAQDVEISKVAIPEPLPQKPTCVSGINSSPKEQDLKPTHTPKKPRPAAGEGFAAFWQAYPRKLDRPGTERWWAKHAPDAALLNTMLIQLALQKESDQWAKRGVIPGPLTWLKRAGWEDDLFGSKAQQLAQDRAEYDKRLVAERQAEAAHKEQVRRERAMEGTPC